MRKTVSVIIPTIEEEAVFGLIKDIRKLLGAETEIIIVDKSGLIRNVTMRGDNAGAEKCARRDTRKH